jgi:hypothetical protein
MILPQFKFVIIDNFAVETGKAYAREMDFFVRFTMRATCKKCATEIFVTDIRQMGHLCSTHQCGTARIAEQGTE